MGIDIHNLNLLAHAQDLGVRFERSLAIGRQALFIEPFELEAHRLLRRLPPLQQAPAPAGAPTYFEPLLTQWLGARQTDSVDASPYEQATHVHDMNLPWPASGPLAGLRGHFDAVLDFGCLEHVFNFPVAWRNCVDLCRVGGHVLHALPANNLCGHGFYQYSPELFCNLYQAARGFELRGLWFAVKGDRRRWWEVANPLQVRRRVNLRNAQPVYLMVLARKLREPGDLPAPQQSDYALDEWLRQRDGHAAGAGPSAAPAVPLRQRLTRRLGAWGLIDPLRAARDLGLAWRHGGWALPGPDYRAVDVHGLIRRTGGQG